MVESVGSSIVQLALAFSRQYSAMNEADLTAIKVCSFAKNVAYALQEAQEEGALESPSDSLRQNLDKMNTLMKQIETWAASYIDAGKKKGRLGRLFDYFYAGSNLDVLKKTSEDVDQAVKDIGLAVRMDLCAGVKDLIEQNNSIAPGVVEALQQHTGRPDDSLLAAKVAKMTNITIEDVQQELMRSMQALQRVENRSQYIREHVVSDLSRQMSGMKISAGVYQAEDLAECLEMAPFSKPEWVDELQGTCGKLMCV
jgi:hypothetical protein